MAGRNSTIKALWRRQLTARDDLLIRTERGSPFSLQRVFKKVLFMNAVFELEAKMLIRFTLENWMSFKNSATFSMVATNLRKFNQRIHKARHFRLLPIAAIFGGNATGKSNLVQAFLFSKFFVAKDTPQKSSLRVTPFLLDPQTANAPTSFKFEVLLDESIYDFSFKIKANKVIEEKLSLITNTKDILIYERHNNTIIINNKNSTDPFYSAIKKGTTDDRLFLTTSIMFNCQDYRSIYDWFCNSLYILTSDYIYFDRSIFYDLNNPYNKKFIELLNQLDLGLSQFITDQLNLTQNNNGQVNAKKLLSVHRDINEDEVIFELGQESSGSLRLMNILPAFISLYDNENKTFIIDELDRSIHTQLTKSLVEKYLNLCSISNKSQLVFTTHDIQLIDDKLLRTDEIWSTDRNSLGETSFSSFSDYQRDSNKANTRQLYLQGRMGGIPKRIFNFLYSD
jgi:AAA15 family ATPase/GTPase